MTVHRSPPRSGAVDLCDTPAALDMRRTIEATRNLRCLGSIVGAPGVGKTTTLRWYAATARGAVYCTMSPGKSTMVQALRLVAEALEPMAVLAIRTAHLHDDICRAAASRGDRMLLIDEAQHLDDRCLDELRCIHDETGLPMIFAGNENLRERVSAAGAAAFAQFASRVGPRLHIRAATAADVDTLARHHGVQNADARAWLRRRCGGTAGLRTVKRLVQLAGVGAEDKIGLADLKGAAAMLGIS